ncbi:DUF2059 domain-containing protein [Acinetobacter gerneri]|uniref:DUF2059 domain-containing protein n=2 Tax=Acinetobacter gerneri TaxID=202952 RepID=A0AAW8JKV6_9GAMM|nr:DUF2059 domain-containing protein [Acinetobacter gerneri]MDQ9010222.1 DUF2059 domain-containing protein [Acinetobacter gerneri]MDQ9014365.1 DUF2059 domain-containing protein [Acinetobacter gerneri]MDQ9025536.1 DUF2059 domain-containing protein [Acinetobacter gerneri]MDQ9052781.1 DUF2059 domain-containing protein [Acinetobacter gerneri]MDQ9060435.1 DUF2059 domain-containing protein [Acinetobacter gerneri]
MTFQKECRVIKNNFGCVMHFYKKMMALLGSTLIGVNVWATPVNSSTAEKYFIYQDLNNKIQLKKVDPKNFQDYAVGKVEKKSQGLVVSEDSRTKATAEIRDIYRDFVLSKLTAIQTNTIDIYKKEFLKQQSEETVKSQLDFYQTPAGKSVLSKQLKKQEFMQNLSKEIPVLISQQDDFQNQLKNALANGAYQ